MPTNKIVLESAALAWREAACKLGFKVVAPYRLECDEQAIDCIAFLPEFGGPQGMVVASTMAPAFDTDPLLVELAQKRNLFYSFMTATGWGEYDEGAFKEALIDWAYFGPADERPAWLAEAQQTQPDLPRERS